MKCNEIIRKIMKDESVTYKDLQIALNYKTVSGVSERLRTGRTGNKMGVDVTLKMLDYLGYELIIRRKEVVKSEENGRIKAWFPEYVISSTEEGGKDDG